ncbi:MAG: anti-sigma factor antagonist [Terriglobales bacterium]
MPLQLESRQVGKVTVVKCAGRIVAGAESDELLARVQKLIATDRNIVLHLGDVQFVDSTGLGLMVRLLTSARAARGDLKLSNAGGMIAQTLKITNLNTLLETHDSEAEAIAAFYQPSAAREVHRTGTAVLCVDRSCSVLAYLRELLRQAGFDPLTTTNVSDGRILMKAAKPAAVILGAVGDGTGAAFRQSLTSVPVIELGEGFSTVEAGEAAQRVLEQLRARVAKAS